MNYTTFFFKTNDKRTVQIFNSFCNHLFISYTMYYNATKQKVKKTKIITGQHFAKLLGITVSMQTLLHKEKTDTGISLIKLNYPKL